MYTCLGLLGLPAHACFFVVCLPPYLSMIRVLSLLFPVFLLLVHVFLHCFAEKLEIKVASGCNDLPDRFRAADPKPNVVTHGVLVKAKAIRNAHVPARSSQCRIPLSSRSCGSNG